MGSGVDDVRGSPARRRPGRPHVRLFAPLGVLVTASWLQGMNPEQSAAVLHDRGPCRLLAGAGSGKTRVVVNRVARLIAEGTQPSRILASTFSVKAAGEMNTRLRLLGCNASVKTWHALCMQILREDATPYAGWTVDEKDRAKMHVKLAVGYKHLNWKGADVTKLRRFIGNAKANLLFPDDPATMELARTFFADKPSWRSVPTISPSSSSSKPRS